MALTSRSNLHDVNNTTLELQQDLARSTPQQCVTLTHSVPSVQMYYALRTKLDTCSEKWLQEFLELDGLDSLLDSLDEMSGRGITCFSDAILQIDCISCVRCVLNTTHGLEYFINSDVYTKKLTMALNCSDTLPKKQVFEMLSAVCVYSNIGYLRVLEGLSYVKSECDLLHRFSLVVQDLQKSETAAHKTAIMTFINALINSTPQVTERIRIRNEFIGVNLLEMLSYVRKDEPGEDLLLQLEVFHERKLSDEESVSANNNIDFNSPQDLQDQIQARVFGTAKMVNFVNILQDLLAIETVYSENSLKLWQAVDDLVHHVIHTMNVRNLDNLQSELRRLPDHLGLALQCVLSYEETVKMACAAQTSDWKMSSAEDCSGNKQCNVTCPSDKYREQDSKLNTFNEQGAVGNIPTSLSKMVNSEQHGQVNRNINLKHGQQSVSINSSTSYDTGTTFQNRTIILGRNNVTYTSDASARTESYVDDETVVIKPSVCSPTEITFFSNKIDDTVNSPPSFDTTNNCSRSGSQGSDGNAKSPSNSSYSNSSHGNENHGDGSQGSGIASGICSNNNHSSISSVLSNQNSGNKTFNIVSNGNSHCAMNINMSESKAFVYNQNKVGTDLGAFGGSTKMSWNASSGNLGKSDKEVDNLFGLGKLQTGYKFDELKGGKQSNRIERRSGPVPHKPMSSLKWITLDDDRIAGRDPCVWLPPLGIQEKITVDYVKLDSAFQVTSPQKSDAIEEIVLLNANTRLKINLFLSRMDSGAEDLVHNLEMCNKSQLSLPMLQYLQKILPCQEEVQMLRHYSGPRLELGMAEQFVLLLSDMPDYAVMLEGHMMHTEFDTTTRQFKTSLNSMVDMAKLVMDSSELKQVLHFILTVGNYLNYGHFHGNAAGYKLSTLTRLGEVKCSGSNRTLLGYLVQTCTDKNTLTFVKQFLKLETCASFSMEEMKEDISKLNGKLRYFTSNLSHASLKLQAMFQPFIEILKSEYGSIQSLTTELRTLTDQLANYFCEDETQFNLQECFKCLIAFCKEVLKCQQECTLTAKQQQQIHSMKTSDVLQKRLKSKLLSLEFGQNAGASSSMMEERSKLLEKILNQLHTGNFNPCVKSEMPTPDPKEPAHPLEMSCIPFIGSPTQALRTRLGTCGSDNVFSDTPELVCASYGSSTVGKLTRSSTQKLRPIKTTCTAQTIKANDDHFRLKQNYPPSPITGGQNSATLHRKLFPLTTNTEEYQEREIICEEDKQKQKQGTKTRRQLELPSRKGGAHRRSRSDMLDSLCIVNKWMEYEKTREREVDCGKAPIAEPESICNLSTLNLENQGKFITNRDIAALQTDDEQQNVCHVENGPILQMPGLPDDRNKKTEKKSSVGGFFSKLGRAVLRPRNVYSDGDQYSNQNGKSVKERKKSFNQDKENVEVNMEPMIGDEKPFSRDYKRYKSEGNANRVSRFFQRGGLYRSSKMKKRNQNANQ